MCIHENVSMEENSFLFLSNNFIILSEIIFTALKDAAFMNDGIYVKTINLKLWLTSCIIVHLKQ